MAESPKIEKLENRIQELKQDMQVKRESAGRLFHYAQQYTGEIDNYFQDLLLENADQLRALLAQQPLATTAGWQEEIWKEWNPATSRESEHIRIGDLVEERSGNQFVAPAYLPFIGSDSTIIIKCNEGSFQRAEHIMQSLVVRTALMLPHQARYTLLDPAGNGLAFPMQKLLPQVRKTSGDVRRDLDQVIKDIQRIISEYLTQSVRSLDEVAPNIRANEKFQFVFAADFPNKYDRRAIEALQSISSTGTPAGVYLFIQYNQNHEWPRDMSIADFKNAHYIDAANPRKSFSVNGVEFNFRPDKAPVGELQSLLFNKLSQAKPPERIIEWNSVTEIEENEWWSYTSETILKTPIAVVGSGNELDVWFGVNDDGQPCAHGMLGAMTGAGKSNLYHVIIGGLATRYSPEELRLYLVDGKNGVEFQYYKELPHVEVVSLRSSAELSRSVLAELLDEMTRRNDLFTKEGVSDLPGYRALGHKLPRILLLVDEYQELFEGDKQGIASDYLLRLAQQGRSAGIHMLLASQRFGASGMLDKKGIFGNIHLRMAMQMARDDIEALTEFGRNGKDLIATCDLPGKIVLNDRSGDDEANHVGKVAFLPAEQRTEIIKTLEEKAQDWNDEDLPRRVVFDGQAPPNLLDNPYLSNLVMRHKKWFTEDELERYARRPSEDRGLNILEWFASESPRVAWLGQEFNVRGQATVVFRRDSSENALIVGNNHSARYGMIAGIVTGLAANLEPAKTEFMIYDGSIPKADWGKVLPVIRESLLEPCGFEVRYYRENAGVESLIYVLSEELERRSEFSSAERGKQPSIFVVMTDLERVRKLRRTQDKFGGMVDSPLGEKLKEIYVEGPFMGIHTLLSFSGVRPMSHIVNPRRGVVNFRHRVALQMSEDESHTFVRSRSAARLQETSEQARALYVDTMENREVTFKPYTQNEQLIADIQTIGQRLARRTEQ